MDVGTHALASIAIIRAVIPRAPLTAWAVVVLVGTAADVDALSTISGPSAYLDWHRTYTHSVIACVIMGAVLGWGYLFLGARASAAKMSKATFLSAVFCAGFLHLAMDACQSEAIAAFWPFNARRVAADWIAGVDPWIIAILVIAILLPELLRLVSDEIGAKDKRPRGRVAAIVGLALVILYVGVRADFHATALAAIQARTYSGESSRRASAYPEPASLFTWRGIVETDHALHELIIDTTPGAPFDPDNGTTLFKPEPSAILEHAQNAGAAKRFLRVASFPKASVEKTTEGYQIQIRDLRYAASGESKHEILALVRMNLDGSLEEDELAWARDLHRR